MPNIPSDFCTATTIRRDRVEFISFGGCNYLGLAHHPLVLKAAQDAIPLYGLSSSASRETTGNARPHQSLESRITEFCNLESGLLVPDGYTANLAALQGLEVLGVKHAVIDQRAHASLKDAANLAKLKIHLFDHLDSDHASQVIADLDEPAVILTDSVFTTDGDLARIHALHDTLKPNDWLLLDDCHGFGVLGDHGNGTANELKLTSNQLIITTTLAKGLGCAGGMVMGASTPIESARNHSIAYRCTTPASPILVAAGMTALELLKSDSTIHTNIQRNINHVREILRSFDLPAHSLMTPIFAFTIGDESNMKHIEQSMLKNSIILPLMDYPNGPAPIYFRLAVNAAHTSTQLEELRTQLTSIMTPKLRVQA